MVSHVASCADVLQSHTAQRPNFEISDLHDSLNSSLCPTGIQIRTQPLQTNFRIGRTLLKNKLATNGEIIIY